ncbi:MAG: hypothetical protein U5K74_13125 [Gemmatimonadaceae bacterium]|nr:hypothetical protein [Gemmatimonadaceae bacterium]
MRHPLEQRALDAAKAALRITDRATGAPRDRTGRHGIRDATVQRHRAPASAAHTDDQIGTVEGMQQRWQAGRVMLTIRVHGHAGRHARSTRDGSSP